ncbi:MAG: hypothetical protein RIR97_57 [Pseudomonadota bacterium]
MTQTADLIIENGRILTLDPENPRVQALAVANGRIIAIGSNDDMAHLRGANTKVIDAKGNTVTPGFSENHMHLFSGAVELEHLQLAGILGHDALKSAVLAYAAKHPNHKFLYAQSADYSILGAGRRLTRHDLDAILPDRPLVLFAGDHHTAWANTKALDVSGLLHGMTVGPGNEIVMGEDGKAEGELREMEAFDPVLIAGGFSRYRLGLATGGEPDPYPDAAEFAIDMDVMRRGLKHCAEHGITTIQNMDGNRYQLELLKAIEDQDGALPCRVKIPFHYKNFMTLDMLEKASQMSKDYQSDFLNCGMVKMFYDGVIDSWTAVMIEPYANAPDEKPQPLFTPEEFKTIATEIDRRGLQIAVHSIGDGAVRAVLDGYEAAQKANGKRDSRHRVEHIEVIHPDDIARFKQLGVIASMQPIHAPGTGFPLEPTISAIGKPRWPYSYAWRTLLNAGARIAFASDWPVSPIDPILGIKAALTREKWQESDPDQTLTLHEALHAYCVEGAYADFSEDRKGMIKPGFYADLVIFDGDMESTDPQKLDELKPATTMCGGRITFSKQ